MRCSRTCRLLLLTGLLFAGAMLLAQGPAGGGPGGGPGGGMGMPGGGGRMGGGMGLPRGDRGNSGGGIGGGRGMGSRGPAPATAGRWWDNKSTAKSLGLNGQQQKRMDTVFSHNRDVLQQRYDTFVKAQTKLDAMKRNSSVSENELFTEIQKTSQARAELEQAYTHMQLQIRSELTPEQAAKLEEQP